MAWDPSNNPNKNPYDTGYQQDTKFKRNETTYTKRKIDDDDKLRDVSVEKKEKSRTTERTDRETVQKNSKEQRSSLDDQSRRKITGNRDILTKATSKQGTGTIEAKHPNLAKPSEKPAINKEIMTGQKQQRPGEMQPQQLLSQLAKLANSFEPGKEMSLGTQLESMIEEYASQNGEDSEMMKKQTSEFMNKRLQEGESSTSGRLNRTLNNKLKQLPERKVPGKPETEVNQRSMNNVRNFPELNKHFQTTSKSTVDKFNEFQKEAKGSVGEGMDKMRTSTKISDEPRIKMLSTFDHQVESSNLPERDKNILHRMFSGELDSPELAKQIPENLRKTFDSFMEKAKAAGDDAMKDLKEMLPEGVDHELEGVKADLEGGEEAEKFIKEQLPDEDHEKTLKEFEKYKKNPSRKTSISPRHLEVFQKAHAKLSAGRSFLASQNRETFTQGWNKKFDEMGIAKDKKFTEAEAKALRDPASALVKNQELLKNQKEVVQILTKAGLKEIDEWPKRYKEVQLKTRGAVDLLIQAPKELVEKLKNGDISFSEFLEQMGTSGKKLLKDIGHKRGMLEGEEFEPDSEILEQVLKKMDTPRMKQSFQAGRFGREFSAVGQDLLDELKQMKQLNLSTTGQGSGRSGSQGQSGTSNDTFTFQGVSTFNYQVAMQSFNNKMANSIAANQIADLEAQGKVSNMKRTASEMQQEVSFRAQQESEESQEQDKGTFGKILTVFKVVAENLCLPPPISMAIDLTIMNSISKGESAWDAMSASAATDLATDLTALGIDSNLANEIASTVMDVLKCAEAIIMSVAAVAFSIVTGGSGIFIALAVLGALFMTVSALGTLGVQLAGIYDPDASQSAMEIANLVFMGIGILGAVCAIPELVANIPSMFSSLARTAGSVYESVGNLARSLGETIGGLFKTGDSLAEAGAGLAGATDIFGDVEMVTVSAGTGLADVGEAGSGVADAETVTLTSEVKSPQDQLTDQLAAKNGEISDLENQNSSLDELSNDIESNPDGVTNMSPEDGAATYGMSESEFTQVQEYVQDGNMEDAKELIKKIQKGKLKQIDKLTKEAQDLEEQITNMSSLDTAFKDGDKKKIQKVWDKMSPEAKRTYYEGNPEKRIPLNELYSKQMDGAFKDAGRVYSKKDWKNLGDTWKEMPQDARETYYMNNKDRVKGKVLDKLNYDLSDDAFKAKNADVAKKMKSDIEFKQMKSVINVTKAWVDFLVNLTKTLQTMVTGEQQIKAAKHEMNAEIDAAEAERLQSLVDSFTETLKQENEFLKQDAEDMEFTTEMANALISTWEQWLSCLDVDTSGLVSSNRSGATTS